MIGQRRVVLTRIAANSFFMSMLAVLSILALYYLTGANRFVASRLNERWYEIYNVLYWMALFVIFIVAQKLKIEQKYSTITNLIIGTLLGYIAGLFAYSTMILIEPGGVALARNTLDKFSFDAFWILAVIPTYLNWLFGVIGWMFIFYLRSLKLQKQ